MKAIPTPEFKKKFYAAMKIYESELHDGCPDCLELGDDIFCKKHEDELMEAVLEPRKCKPLQEILRS